MKYILALFIASLAATAGYFFYTLSKKPGVITPPPALSVTQTRKSTEVPVSRFTDVTAVSGIAFRHFNGMSGQKLLPETMGGGVAVIDFDQDGKPDLFFVNGCAWPGQTKQKTLPKLYRNMGNGKFEDVGEKFGFTQPMFGMGVAVGDIDNDGYPDLFISCVGKNCLLKNLAGKGFQDISSTAGVAGDVDLPRCNWEEFLKWDKPIPFSSSATFVDYDGDGKLDLFVCNYVTWSPVIDLSINSTATGVGRSFGQPRDFNGSTCRLYRNIDGTKFEDVSATSGVQVFDNEGTNATDRKRAVGKSLGVILCDPDDDGWPDLMIANDTVRNFFFHNEPGPNSTRIFKEIGVAIGTAYPDDGRARGGMGIDWGEFRPGKSAMVIANFAQEPLTFLQRSLRDNSMRFTDTTLAVGLVSATRQPLKFGTFFFDYDLDGRLDLFLVNGHIEPEIAKIQGGQSYEQSAQLFWNTGEDQPVFEPVPRASSGEDLARAIVGRGTAYLDFDGDGDLDIVMVGNGGPALLMRNDTQLGNQSVRLLLEGTNANRSAIGAKVLVTVAGKTHERTVVGSRGYLSQSEFPVTIGLGTARQIDKVVVRWPGKTSEKQEWTTLSAGKTYRLKQGQTEARQEPVK